MKIFNRLIYLAATLLMASCQNSTEKHYQGYIEAQNTYLSSPYSGALTLLAVQRGDFVKKGQLLFQLDKNPEAIMLQKTIQDVEQAKHSLQDLQAPRRPSEISAIEAQIAQVDAKISLAQLRVQRYKTLHEKNAVPKDTLDAAEIELEQQQKLKEEYQDNLTLAKQGSRPEQINAQTKQLESLQSTAEEIQWKLNQKTLHAPEAGYVFDTYFTIGEFVDNARAVLSLIATKDIYVVFFVPVEELAKIKVGDPVSILCEGCNNESSATIGYISPEAEFLPPLVYSRENREKLVFRIQADFKGLTSFKPGQPVTVLLP